VQVTAAAAGLQQQRPMATGWCRQVRPNSHTPALRSRVQATAPGARFAQQVLLAVCWCQCRDNCVCPADMSRAASAEPDFYTQTMNVLCPLDDECLPLEAANLKTRQVRHCSGCEMHASKHTAAASRKATGCGVCSCAEEHGRHCGAAFPSCAGSKTSLVRLSANIWVVCRCVFQVEVALARLKDSELDHDDHLVCLEALARLAWSDDIVRQVGAGWPAHTTNYSL
jgi:hypothetical protein